MRSASSGYRLGKNLPRVIPLIVKYCDNPKFESDDELRENCFQAFEALVLKCPKDISPFLGGMPLSSLFSSTYLLIDIIPLCLKFIKYDPNYAEDTEGGETMEDEGDEEQEEE